jgi:hypothetical protein
MVHIDCQQLNIVDSEDIILFCNDWNPHFDKMIINFYGATKCL